MAARTRYPKPDCPTCGKSSSYVKNTYYTKREEILRMRKCNFCGWQWWTYQEIEMTLSPEKYRMKIPKFATNGNKIIDFEEIK